MMSFFTQARRVVICGLAGALFIPAAQAGIIEGVNHTHWAINKFSVDGRSGLDTIGPWQRGGGGHFSFPSRWKSGMTVQVDWTTGVAYPDRFPGYGDRAKYRAWIEEVEAQTRHHTKVVPVLDFTGQDVCGVTVHFQPCNEIQITTSCHRYGHPEYPIKTPLKLPEPTSYPASGAIR